MSFTSYDEIREVLEDVQFNDWEFCVRPHTAGGQGDIAKQLYSLPIEEIPHYLQVQFTAADLVTGEPERQYCRKWSLGLSMTPTEVVYTAFKAVMAALEHEAREQFRYKGASVLGPHVGIDGLVELTRKASGHDHETGQWVKS